MHSRRVDMASTADALFSVKVSLQRWGCFWIKKAKFLCVLKKAKFLSGNKGIVLNSVQQPAFRSTHCFFKAGHMLKWASNYCKMVEKSQHANFSIIYSNALQTLAHGNYPHGRTNQNRWQWPAPDKDLRWDRGREVHAQVMLSLPLGLQESSRTGAHGKETKCTQLVNSTTWLNKQFPH